MIVGARDILEIAPLATLLGTVLGTTIGLAQGYLRGAFDMIVGRIVDAALSLPIVIVAFLFVVAVGPSTLTLIIVIGFVFSLIIARTVRTAVLQERELDYIAAARLRDESVLHVMFVEILPNVLGPIIVEFTVRLGYADIHDRDAVVPRLRRATAHARLGRRHRHQLQLPRRRLLVGDAVPGARDRFARHRDQPHRRRDRGGARPMTLATSSDQSDAVEEPPRPSR